MCRECPAQFRQTRLSQITWLWQDTRNGVQVMALGKVIDVTFKLDCLVREDKDSKSFVSFCPALDLYSAGRSRVESREALTSAIAMYLRICYERKVLSNVLHGRNFQAADPLCVDLPTAPGFIAIKESMAEYDDEFRIEVPMHLLAQQQQQKTLAQAV
jgi:hypothetical protein